MYVAGDFSLLLSYLYMRHIYMHISQLLRHSPLRYDHKEVELTVPLHTTPMQPEVTNQRTHTY